MRFVDVIYAYLSNYAGLTALVGDAIYPEVIPQDVPPAYVAMHEVGRDKIYTHNGFCGSSKYNYQLSAFAKTKDAVEMISQQIANAMAAWRAANSSVGYALEESESDTYRVELGEVFCIDLAYIIFYNE